MLTRLEGERLGAAIHALRPDWPLTSLLTFIKRNENKPLLELTIELAWVAQLPDSKTPARIDADGPWKRALIGAGLQAAPQYRAVLPTDCGICSRPFEFHSALSKLDDHEYEPLADRKHGVGPTPEQKAAIQAAAIEAQKVRPEPAPKRPPRDPATVIAEHASTPEERETA